MGKNIGVFCASSDRVDPVYGLTAREFGTWIGEQGYTLVYGGCSLGLMEVVAKAARAAGADVVGVVPDIIEARGCISEEVTRVIDCKNLSERKDLIIAESDILIALPGGIGTLDEVFTALAAHTIGYYAKRVVLYNVQGFWDEQLAALRSMERAGFLSTPLDELLFVADSFSELVDAIEA